ncbi:MAG: hypothetical protein ACKOUK_03205 [Verrucomicrobiota bacterium]
MRSLFEEQILAEQRALVHHLESSAEATAEATSYFPAHPDYQLPPDLYLRQLEHLKSILSIPVIASLNGCRTGGWTEYARRFAASGADAIELNLYHLSTRPEAGASDVEAELLETVASVTHAVQLVSVLLRHGPRVLATLLSALRHWLSEHGYEDLRQLRGALGLRRCPDPSAFERAYYIRILQSWRI